GAIPGHELVAQDLHLLQEHVEVDRRRQGSRLLGEQAPALRAAALFRQGFIRGSEPPSAKAGKDHGATPHFVVEGMRRAMAPLRAKGRFQGRGLTCRGGSGKRTPVVIPVQSAPWPSPPEPRDIFSYKPFWAKRLTPAPFLPMSAEEMEALGWDSCDIIVVTGDAYVDHPSFGM